MDTKELNLALLYLIIGASIFPFIRFLTMYLKRKKLLKEEQERLKKTKFILSGNIEHNSLYKNIKSLIELQRQGALHIIIGRRKGYILFRNGFIIDSFYRNTSGFAGVKELLSLSEGEYFFESRPITQPRLVFEDINSLLINNDNSEELPREG